MTIIGLPGVDFPVEPFAFFISGRCGSLFLIYFKKQNYNFFDKDVSTLELIDEWAAHSVIHHIILDEMEEYIEDFLEKDGILYFPEPVDDQDKTATEVLRKNFKLIYLPKIILDKK